MAGTSSATPMSLLRVLAPEGLLAVGPTGSRAITSNGALTRLRALGDASAARPICVPPGRNEC